MGTAIQALIAILSNMMIISGTIIVTCLLNITHLYWLDKHWCTRHHVHRYLDWIENCTQIDNKWKHVPMYSEPFLSSHFDRTGSYSNFENRSLLPPMEKIENACWYSSFLYHEQESKGVFTHVIKYISYQHARHNHVLKEHRPWHKQYIRDWVKCWGNHTFTWCNWVVPKDPYPTHRGNFRCPERGR